MKQIIKSLEKQLEKLREHVQKREDYVDTRSEEWQESNKCEEYTDKTQDIEAQADELDTLLMNLKN